MRAAIVGPVGAAASRSSSSSPVAAARRRSARRRRGRRCSSSGRRLRDDGPRACRSRSPRPGRPPLSLALGFRADPEARDLARGRPRCYRGGNARRRGALFATARLARGQGRGRVRVLARGHARPAGAAREALSGERGRPAPPRARAALGAAAATRLTAWRAASRRAGHAVRGPRREPPLPEAPSRAAGVRPVVLGARRGIVRSRPARQLDALRGSRRERRRRASGSSTASGSSASAGPCRRLRSFDRAARWRPDDAEAQVAAAVGRFDKDAPGDRLRPARPAHADASRASRPCASTSASCCSGPGASTRRAPVPPRVAHATRLAARARGRSLPRDDPAGARIAELSRARLALTPTARVTTV